MKKYSIYTVVGAVLFVLNFVIIIFEGTKVFTASNIYELVLHNEGSRLPYLFISIIASGTCLIIGLTIDIREDRRKTKAEADFYEQEIFLEEFFEYNSDLYATDESKIKAEIIERMLKAIHKGSNNRTFQLIYKIDVYYKKIKELESIINKDCQMIEEK